MPVTAANSRNKGTSKSNTTISDIDNTKRAASPTRLNLPKAKKLHKIVTAMSSGSPTARSASCCTNNSNSQHHKTKSGQVEILSKPVLQKKQITNEKTSGKKPIVGRRETMPSQLTNPKKKKATNCSRLAKCTKVVEFEWEEKKAEATLRTEDEAIDLLTRNVLQMSQCIKSENGSEIKTLQEIVNKMYMK